MPQDREIAVWLLDIINQTPSFVITAANAENMAVAKAWLLKQTQLVPVVVAEEDKPAITGDTPTDPTPEPIVS